LRRPITEDDIRRVYRETIDDLYGFIASRCEGDCDLAEDVAQETWLIAVRVWYADGLPDRPLAWLTTVSRNVLANHYRRRLPERLEDIDETALAAPADSAGPRRSLIARALARLPLPQIRLLEAFHFERRPIAEIAATEGLSERAVEGRLRRARQRLRQHIESDPDSEGDIV
jgi:RNA polymerase sigma-70 factor (ECF subfamily)